MCFVCVGERPKFFNENFFECERNTNSSEISQKLNPNSF